MSAFILLRNLVAATLVAAALLATASMDAALGADALDLLFGGGIGLLTNAETGKCLTIAGGTSSANNLTAVQFDCDGDLSRLWLISGANDHFQIQNAKTGKCLFASRNSPQNNLEAIQFDCSADFAQAWNFQVTALEELLVNVKTGKCLTISGGTSSANNLTAVQFDCDDDLSRRWFVGVPLVGKLGTALGGGDVQIENAKTGKCLTIAGGTSSANNLTAVQFDCDGDLSRSWFVMRVADGDQIQNAKTGKCLTIAGGTSPQNNLEAVQFDCDADPSRAWHRPAPAPP